MAYCKFEHRVRRREQKFGKIATTTVLNKDEICYLFYFVLMKFVLIRVTMTMFKCDCADCLVLYFSLVKR